MSLFSKKWNGERPFGLAAVAPRHQPDRPFRGDMDEVGLRLGDMRGDGARAGERQANFRIGRTGKRAEVGRREEDDLEAELACLDGQSLIGADNPIHLGMPGVGRNEHAHQAAASNSSTGTSTLLVRCGDQRMISNSPSSVSPTAVQLSTQSPVLI